MNTNTKSAFLWIINILKKLNIPFQVTGGLAAIAYGSTRILEDIDIDIPEDKFALIKPEVGEFIIYGPKQYKDESWDILLMTLSYHGQLIDLSGAFHIKIYNKNINKWKQLPTDFSTVEIKNVFGIEVPIISKKELIYYKKAIARPVDLMDVDQITRNCAAGEINDSKIRRTSRAIILNTTNQILLLRINDKPLQDKSNRDQPSFWVTVGGGVEENESVEDALQRELREEVGIVQPVEFELVAFGEQVLPWKGFQTRFIEKFYVVRTDQINLDNRNLTSDETKMIGEYRWWTIDELLTTNEVVFPGCLAILIKDYINFSGNKWIAREIALD